MGVLVEIHITEQAEARCRWWRNGMGDFQIGDRIIHLVLREVAIGLKEPVILLVWMLADEFVEEGDCSAVLLSH